MHANNINHSLYNSILNVDDYQIQVFQVFQIQVFHDMVGELMNFL